MDAAADLPPARSGGARRGHAVDGHAAARRVRPRAPRRLLGGRVRLGRGGGAGPRPATTPVGRHPARRRAAGVRRGPGGTRAAPPVAGPRRRGAVALPPARDVRLSRRHPGDPQRSRRRPISLPSALRGGAPDRLAARISLHVPPDGRAARSRPARRRDPERAADDDRSRQGRRKPGGDAPRGRGAGGRGSRGDRARRPQGGGPGEALARRRVPEYDRRRQRAREPPRGARVRPLRGHHVRGRHPRPRPLGADRPPRTRRRRGRAGRRGAPRRVRARSRRAPVGQRRLDAESFDWSNVLPLWDSLFRRALERRP